MSIQIPQVSYPNFPDDLYEGMVVDAALTDFHTRYLEVNVAPGRGVVKGASYDTAKLPTSSAEVTNNFKGVTRYEAGREPIGTTEVTLAAFSPVALVKKGPVCIVPFGSALVDDGPVYCIHGNLGGNAGKFRGDAGAGNDAGTLVAGAKVRKGAIVGALAIVDFDVA